jgi:hypothetical protein
VDITRVSGLKLFELLHSLSCPRIDNNVPVSWLSGHVVREEKNRLGLCGFQVGLILECLPSGSATCHMAHERNLCVSLIGLQAMDPWCNENEALVMQCHSTM